MEHATSDAANGPAVWAYLFVEGYFDLDGCKAELGWMDVPLPRKSGVPSPGDLLLLVGASGVLHAVVEVERNLGKTKAPRETRRYWKERKYRKVTHPRVRVRFVSRDTIGSITPSEAEISRLRRTQWFRLTRLPLEGESTGVGDEPGSPAATTNARITSVASDGFEPSLLAQEQEEHRRDPAHDDVLQSTDTTVAQSRQTQSVSTHATASFSTEAGEACPTVNRYTPPDPLEKLQANVGPEEPANASDAVRASRPSRTVKKTVSHDPDRHSEPHVRSWGHSKRRIVLALSGPEYINALRSKLGLTQEGFADRIRTTQSAVSKWERGVSVPGEHDWAHIQAEFGDIELASTHNVASRTQSATIQLPLEERRYQCRRILKWTARFGEIDGFEIQQLGIAEDVLETWADSLLTYRPGGCFVVTPLFIDHVGTGAEPEVFTDQLALTLLGDSTKALRSEQLGIEDHVWEHLGTWHLTLPGEPTERDELYLRVPVSQGANRNETECLDVFSKLPAPVIRRLIENPEFVSQQSEWSARDSSLKGLGVLSRQAKLGMQRPLFLSTYRLSLTNSGYVSVRSSDRREVIKRQHVVSGLPLYTADEWKDGIAFEREAATERLLENPLHAVLVQLEMHRLVAGLHGQASIALRPTSNGECIAEISDAESQPLWRVCRVQLTSLDYLPVGQSARDSFWTDAVQIALANLMTLGVMENVGGRYQFSESFKSKLVANPGHAQNRGEKTFRVHLLQYIESLRQGGAG